MLLRHAIKAIIGPNPCIIMYVGVRIGQFCRSYLYLCAAFAYVRVHVRVYVGAGPSGGGGGGGGGGTGPLCPPLDPLLLRKQLGRAKSSTYIIRLKVKRVCCLDQNTATMALRHQFNC